MAMSSTAIVIKLMAERLELESEHGKRVVGILLFQDLAVVPLLVLIPALGADPDDLLRALGLAMLKATVLLVLLLTGGQRIMRWWLTLVARRKSEELFMLNLLLITLGLAWLTEHAGLSLALGETWSFHWSPLAWGSMLAQTVVGAFASYLAWMWMLGRYPATKISVFVFLTPLFALLFGTLLLGEAITTTLLIALGLVAMGIVLVNRKPT